MPECSLGPNVSIEKCNVWCVLIRRLQTELREYRTTISLTKTRCTTDQNKGVLNITINVTRTNPSVHATLRWMGNPYVFLGPPPKPRIGKADSEWKNLDDLQLPKFQSKIEFRESCYAISVQAQSVVRLASMIVCFRWSASIDTSELGSMFGPHTCSCRPDTAQLWSSEEESYWVSLAKEAMEAELLGSSGRTDFQAFYFN